VSSYVLFYVVSVQLLTNSRKLLITVQAVSALGVGIAFLAILQRVTAPDTLFWFRKLSEGKTAFGPWVYKNHYAGFMVMLCPLVVAQFLLNRPPMDRLETFREKILAFFSENGAVAHLFWGFGSVVILVSVFLTQSRGGILSVMSAFMLFFLLLVRQKIKIRVLPLLVLVSGLLIVVGWYSWEPILERFGSIMDSETGRVKDDRLLVWKDTLKILASFPLTGSGFGTFVDIFPSYKTLADNLLYEHAHNDFLELLTEGGLIGGAAGLWFIMSVVKTGCRMIGQRHDRISVFYAVSALSSLAGILVYSVFDFNLHNGANGLYFIFFCALLVSAGNTRRYYQHSPTLLVPVQSSQSMRSFFFIAALMLFSTVLLLQGRKVLAEKYYQEVRTVASQTFQKPLVKAEEMAGLLEKAKNIDPMTGLYAHALANLKKWQQKREEAISLSAEAVMCQPMNFFFLQQLGHMLSTSDPVTAQILFETGYRRASQKALAFQEWAEFELSFFSEQQGLKRLKKELEQNPGLLRLLYPLLIQYRLDQKEVTAVLPQQTSAWIGFWDQVKKEDMTEKYGFALEHALDFVNNDPDVQPRYFVEVARYYRLLGNPAKEEEALRHGIRLLPTYAPFHIHLGEIYLKGGNERGAIKEFEQALLLNPENKGLRHRVKKMLQE
ncbi:MAG: hypothetical protein D3910_12265, partial [Candidatus Electrothrix sp. ATG2]|nr:hypothetical protein [Candidatus Electrothrix sp. ATG2]